MRIGGGGWGEGRRKSGSKGGGHSAGGEESVGSRVLCWAILPVASCTKRKCRRSITGIINRAIEKIPRVRATESESDKCARNTVLINALTEIGWNQFTIWKSLRFK